MIEITTIEQLDACLEASGDKPLFIFKHSTRCPISSRANVRVREFIESPPTSGEAAPEIYLLKVVESRAVSNALAGQLGIMHQSPQLLLIDKGKCTWHTSHHNINARNIEKAIQSAAAVEAPEISGLRTPEGPPFWCVENPRPPTQRVPSGAGSASASSDKRRSRDVSRGAATSSGRAVRLGSKS